MTGTCCFSGFTCSLWQREVMCARRVENPPRSLFGVTHKPDIVVLHLQPRAARVTHLALSCSWFCSACSSSSVWPLFPAPPLPAEHREPSLAADVDVREMIVFFHVCSGTCSLSDACSLVKRSTWDSSWSFSAKSPSTDA